MREAIAALILLLAACVCANAQQPGPPPQSVIVWQPVVVQGYWQPVPRPYAVGNFLFGPIYVFTPIQPQPQR
jgi:hypothetical protein